MINKGALLLHSLPHDTYIFSWIQIHSVRKKPPQKHIQLSRWHFGFQSKEFYRKYHCSWPCNLLLVMCRVSLEKCTTKKKCWKKNTFSMKSNHMKRPHFCIISHIRRSINFTREGCIFFSVKSQFHPPIYMWTGWAYQCRVDFYNGKHMMIFWVLLWKGQNSRCYNTDRHLQQHKPWP